jgi:hypothetical protein
MRAGRTEIEDRQIMRTVLFALAALTAFAGIAEARDGCGRGFFFNGVRCVPIRAVPPPVVVVPPPPPVVVRPAPVRGWAPAGPDRWGQMTFWPGPRGQCPPRYTVQDGLCKPYRGF